MFKCKCGKEICQYNVFYEENGRFKAHLYQCLKCGCCQIEVHYLDGEIKKINGFKKEFPCYSEKRKGTWQ